MVDQTIFLARHRLIFTLISSSGSGTTGVVALDLRRRFVGYEINGDFCRLSEKRWGSLNEVENTP